MSEKRRHTPEDGADEVSNPTAKRLKTVENEMDKISIPISIDLETFVSSRKDELTNLTNVVKVKMRKLVSQQLPRHLRRRIVSHNKKRLPRRLQPWFNAEAAKETKRQSRLHRRRPRNLQEDYERRSRENRWLETHIWHAKRFRMIDSFGYRIPESSFDKSLRACYRGAAKYCLLNDISYYSCIELKGRQEDICAGFAKHTVQETGLGVAAKKFIEGLFQGIVHLYEENEYPFGFIGTVSFMWRPRSNAEDERMLWVWCHPELRETLLKLFARFSNPTESEEMSTATEKQSSVTVEDLRDKLNRFRLTGPLAVRALCETLTQDESDLNVGLKIPPSYFNSFWSKLSENSLSASSYIRDNQIVGNIVLDPRLHMPTKRLVASVVGSAEDEASGSLFDLEQLPVNTDIWDCEFREKVKQEMLTQDEINKLRQKNLVPGTLLDLGEKESRIPIMVIFRSGSQENLGYSRGCDIIVPSGWGRQFFIALNYRAARAAGLRDLNAVTRHSNEFVFPDDIPDSVLAQRYLTSETEKFIEKHFTYPPNKRPAFLRLGIFHPYSMPFDKLVASYLEFDPSKKTSPPPPLHVIRNRAVLRKLAQASKNGKFMSQSLENQLENVDVQSALVPVKLVSVSKGVPERFARIYVIPETLDDCIVLPGERNHPKTYAESLFQNGCYANTEMNAETDNQFPMIGFVVSGDRNLTGKTASALGYVSLNGLLKMTSSSSDGGSIAFRNQNVFNYHRVRMQVIV